MFSWPALADSFSALAIALEMIPELSSGREKNEVLIQHYHMLWSKSDAGKAGYVSAGECIVTVPFFLL